MDENDFNLDTEFKRYLQIMRPYLSQLLDQDVIEICKAWIQRLSNCDENEKILRNKYVFALCYQLAKGMLEKPFVNYPESKPLAPISEELDSDFSGTIIDYLITDFEEQTKILYDNIEIPMSDTDNFSQETEYGENKSKVCSKESVSFEMKGDHKKSDHPSLLRSNCQEVSKDNNRKNKDQCDEYKHRANNLVLKLREIKTENILLHKELEILREEFKIKKDCNENHIVRVDCCTSACYHGDDSATTLNSLKNELQEAQDSKKNMLYTINRLQEELSRFDETKRHAIDEIEANYKMEIIKIKTETREETKEMFERKLDELKEHYEKMIENIQSKLVDERQLIIKSKDEIITEKEKMLNAKDVEIGRLKTLVENQKTHLHDVITKFIEKSSEGSNTSNTRVRNDEFEKRLDKFEKSKSKCVRVYENKLAHLQREKHLAECSLQIQLVRQKTQVVNELTEENQAELNSALTKLESKYKEIVANMQATAIQRRMQDQMALESILHAACGIRNESYSNYSPSTHHSQFSGQTMQNQNKNGNQMNQSFDSEKSTLLHRNKVGSLIRDNKSLGEGSLVAGYCLDGERMGELFERVYIPQKDMGDGPLKK